jgi:3-methylornithyl-N6-L-lysine dehydrogenase
MAHLKPADLVGLSDDLAEFDRRLSSNTGSTLRQIACRACNTREADAVSVLPNVLAAIVPGSRIEASLPGMSGHLDATLKHIGFKTMVPASSDVSGLATAIEEGADIVFMADEDRSIALVPSVRKVVDNSEATGRGYAAALESCLGSLADRKILIIGAGVVGTACALKLQRMHAHISVFDQDFIRAADLSAATGCMLYEDLKSALYEHTIIVDASPAEGIIAAQHITDDTWIAAPGIPLGLTEEARVKIGNRLIHYPVRIAVATMAITALTLLRRF